MSIVIEKNVPIPAPRSGPSSKINEYVNAISEMEVGDSILFSDVIDQSLNGYAARVRKMTGENRKFTCRKVSARVYRMWRIK